MEHHQHQQHQRLSTQSVEPAAYEAALCTERYVRCSGLPKALNELGKVRASQLSGCAYCLDMHARDARVDGEDQRRLDALPAWWETPQLRLAVSAHQDLPLPAGSSTRI